MTEVLRIVVLGNPGDGKVNTAYRTIMRGRKPATIKSAKARAFDARATLAVRRACTDHPSASEAIRNAVTVQVRITAHWPRGRHLDEGLTTVGHGDVDAPIKLTLDAMEHAGLFDDDCRVVRVDARKRYDKDCPRIEIEAWPSTEISDVSSYGPIARVLGLVPQPHDDEDIAAVMLSGLDEDEIRCPYRSTRLTIARAIAELVLRRRGEWRG